MTEKELKQLYFLNREIEHLQKEINNKRCRIGYKSPTLSDMPKGGIALDYTDQVAELIDLERVLIENLKRVQIERLRLEKFIGGISDAEIRMIIRLRHINGLSWQEIGNELYMSYESARRKYNTHLKDVKNVK